MKFHSCYEFACKIMQIAYQQGLLVQKIPVCPILSADYPTPAKRPPFSVLDCQKYMKTTQQPIAPWPESLQQMMAQLG